MLSTSPCRADPAAGCKVAIAALSLPDNFTGEVHWRASAKDGTSPLQLSKRYFSEHLKVPRSVIQFYREAVVADQEEPLPEPLLTVKIAAGIDLAYVVLRTESGKDGSEEMKATIIPANLWKPGCLKVFNASPDTVGMIAGKKKIQLPRGKSLDFHANQWQAPFPVKIYQLQPKSRLLFSSTWRVAAGRRELCFIGMAGKAVKLRSLIEFKKPPPKNN
ncbi:MAG: hypothetical protein AB8F34_10275 [Akkermansiaceae bacterium]